MRRSYLLVLLFAPLFVTAQLQIAKIFTNNMVLQRDQPIQIWGKGIPGKEVAASFDNGTQKAVVKADSSWRVFFGRQKANAQPQSIVISSGQERIELENILIGDLWLCLGQSNMECPMKQEMHYQTELPKSNQPLLRFYNPIYAGKNIFGKAFTDSVMKQLKPNDFYKGQWQACDSNSIKEMSAVGYYFGKEVLNYLDIPVGLINLAIGGAPIETFISREVMQNDRQFAVKVTGNWLTNDVLPVWIRERGNQNIGNWQSGISDTSGPDHAFKPGFAYDAGIKPILSFPVKGIIWYQGESNAQEIERVTEYGKLLMLMIDDYRDKWRQSEMPFYWVQLSSIDTINYKSHLWPMFRDEQRKLLDTIKNGGMAVCSDIGSKNDVHPTNKKAVGERLARWALSKEYKKNIVPSGPLPLTANYNNGKVVINFQYVAKGLQTADERKVRGFSINGKDEIEATVQGNAVVIVAEEKPEFIYYAWKPFTDANLVNSELLPASTFKIKVR